MKIVTLVSGGFDSTLMSIVAQEEGLKLHPLFIDYGQLGAKKEWETCKKLHKKHNLPQVTPMDLSGFGAVIPSGITDNKLRINEDAFLPGRNLLLLLVGAAYAYSIQAHAVAIGLLDPKYHLFPDQTHKFIEKSECIIATTMGKNIKILAPLLEFSKNDILAMAKIRNLKGTYSCHAGGSVPCGKCVACQEIKNAKERS